jgi:hypothetical protein
MVVCQLLVAISLQESTPIQFKNIKKNQTKKIKLYLFLFKMQYRIVLKKLIKLRALIFFHSLFPSRVVKLWMSETPKRFQSLADNGYLME